MKKSLIFVLFFFFLISSGQNNNQSVGFIENKGQIIDQNEKKNENVKYLLNTNGLNVQLRQNGFSYDVYETKKNPKKNNKVENSSLIKLTSSLEPKFNTKYNFHRIDIDFLNSNPNVNLIAEEKTKDYDNYYNVNHAPNGILEVYKFKKVTYKNIYNNIDVVFFIPEDISKPVEYNFIVNEGGKISDIQLKFSGAKTDLVDNKIKMKVRFGEMEETIPRSWIENGNSKDKVEIGYKKIKNNLYGLETQHNLVGQKLIIDPTPIRLWGTYYGKGANTFLGLENDDFDNIYLCGQTDDATNFATSGSFMSVKDFSFDGFISKFDSNGNRIWGTYYGGNNNDSFSSISHFNNQLILSGTTRSTNNIATTGAFKETLTPGGVNTTDGFITKFDLNGFRIWGTYFGGEHNDFVNKSIVDGNGNIILVGGTYSINGIATLGTFKESKSLPVNYSTTSEGFIVKFTNSGFQEWGSYYNICLIWGLDVDSNSNIFFSGDVTNGIPNFATTGTHQPTYSYNTETGISNNNSFVIKFNPNGQRVWGTYYGNGTEKNNCLKVDHADDVLISGHTRSTTLIATPGSHQPILSSNGTFSDAYLAKFNQNGQLIWGTYYGSDDQEDLPNYVVDVDENNNIFFAGNTVGVNNIATPNTFSTSSNGLDDSFIIKFDTLGTRIWGTFFGGASGDLTMAIKYNKLGLFYIAGNTFSTNNIATPGSHQETSAESRSYFLQKFSDCFSSNLTSSNSPICTGSNLNLTASGGTNYAWTGPNGFTSNLQNPQISNVSILNSGNYTCVITGTGGCDGINTIPVTIQNTPTPTGNTNQEFCSTASPTLNNITISGTTINWYATNTSTTILPITTTLTDGANYYATQTINGCESVDRFSVTVSLISSLNANDYSQSLCDDLNDGSENLVLSDYNTNLIASTSGITFTYYSSFSSAENQILVDQLNSNYTVFLGSTVVYVRLDSINGCHQIVELNLSLFQKPIISINDIIPICKNSNIVVNAGSGFNSYSWSTGASSQSIVISVAGTYTVTVTKNYGSLICSTTKTFTLIESEIANITSIQTEDWTDVDNVITVNTSGNGSYQYSIDGINYQDSNTFSGLLSGFYTVYVRDKNECGIVDENVFLLNYPKFFTPNDDGTNDNWRIKFSQFEPNLTVTIFDRYGKIMKVLNSNSAGWDGTYNGTKMISDDYWFVVKRQNGQEHRAHFTLKR